MTRALGWIIAVLILLGCGLGETLAVGPTPTRTPLVASHLPLSVNPVNVQLGASPNATNTPLPFGGALVTWQIVRSDRFAVSVPSSLQIDIPLSDVWLSPATAQVIFSGKDSQTGLQIQMLESRALFGTARGKLENRKNDFDISRDASAVLKLDSGISVNGREAAVAEFVRNGLATVEYYIVAEQEEIDIVVKQGKPDDTPFIATAERIANSFSVDSSMSPLQPIQAMRADAFLPRDGNQTWWYSYHLQGSAEVEDISSIEVRNPTTLNDSTIKFTLDMGANYNETHDLAEFLVSPKGLVLTSELPRAGASQDQAVWKGGVPVLHLPLQTGQVWKTDTQMYISTRSTQAAPWTIEANVESRGPIAVNGVSYPDCVRVSYTANGELSSKWTYCFALGPVLIEQPTAAGMLQGDLLGVMNARLGIVAPYGNPNPCDLTFTPTGFDSGEAVEVRIVHPDGKTVTRESIQIGAQENSVKLKATNQDPAGAWVAYADGTKHHAMYVLHWPGKCN